MPAPSRRPAALGAAAVGARGRSRRTGLRATTHENRRPQSGQRKTPASRAAGRDLRHRAARDILQRVVTWQLAKRRAGTHKVLTRGEVNRTKKKMYKQKGTGGPVTARARRRLFVGGAKAMGPVQHSHEFDLPKKVRRWAAARAVVQGQGRRIVVLDEPSPQRSRPPPCARFGKLGVGNALVVDGEFDKNFQLAPATFPHVDAAAERRPQRLRHPAPRQAGADHRDRVKAIEERFGDDASITTPSSRR
jgi:large subunit ribosomal protein L4